MRSLEVQAGACGYTAKITIHKVDERHVRVEIESSCDQITAMSDDLACLQWKGKGHEVFRPMNESAVYRSASAHIRHTACPIPSAILKAIEVEVGAALPQDVTIHFRPRGTEGD
ncbi:MAG TPA: hypothetical protein VLD63_03075 [Anaerolineales bacterium]|nr:hypothetical protein [Anaerolineales bacterium]